MTFQVTFGFYDADVGGNSTFVEWGRMQPLESERFQSEEEAEIAAKTAISADPSLDEYRLIERR